MKRLLVITLAMVFIGAADLAQAADQPNPTGTWKWSVTFGGQSRETVLKLKLEGDKLTGVIVRRNGQESAIQDAKCKDGEMSFSVVRERDGQKMTVKYSGKVSEDAIKGKVEFERDGQTRSRDWEAKREAAAQPAAATSVAGTWNLTAEVNGETHEMTLKLKEEGDKLTGVIVGRDGNERALKDAKCKDGDLSFTIVMERDGEDFPLNATAKVTGDTMKGTTKFKLDGEEHTLTWEAKRPAAAKPAETAAANPVGSWKLSIEINGEPREMTLKLKQEGDKLTGALVGSSDKETVLKDVKCKDGDLSFTVDREQDGETVTLKNSAKLTGDTMKGNVEFELDGQAQSLPWEAKRIKD